MPPRVYNIATYKQYSEMEENSYELKKCHRILKVSQDRFPLSAFSR